MPAGVEPAPEADGSTELAELAGGFIHEIKNHLSTLGLNLQLFAEDFHEPQSQRERRALERIQRLDPKFNSFLVVTAERALEDARKRCEASPFGDVLLPFPGSRPSPVPGGSGNTGGTSAATPRRRCGEAGGHAACLP